MHPAIARFFNSAPQQAAQVQQPQVQQQVQQAPQVPGQMNNPQQLQQPQIDAAGNPIVAPANVPTNIPDPVDELTQLLQNKNTPDAANKTADPFALDQKQLSERIQAMNLVGNINPEQLQAAVGASGDPKVLLEILNQVARSSLQVGISVSNQMVQAGHNVTANQLRQEIPNSVRADTAIARIVETIPAAKPFVAMTVENLQRTNPHLTQNQLESLAMAKINAFMDQVHQTHPATIAEQQKVQTAAKRGGAQWEGFFQDDAGQ